MIERPGDQTLVFDRHAVEPLVESFQRARDRIAPLVRFNLWISPIGRQHRVERERHEQRNEDRRCDSEGEWLEPLAGHSIHECDGHKHRHDRERRRGDGETDLVGAFVRRRHVILTQLDVPYDVLAHHDPVVDEDTDRQRETEQRHGVERETERPYRDERRQHRDRQRQSRDHRRSPRVQEHEHHQDRE